MPIGKIDAIVTDVEGTTHPVAHDFREVERFWLAAA
jgi:hypothetical protein